MINKSFDLIEKVDIDALVGAKETERRSLEYKAELPGELDEAKREFLSDICSFANSAGGDILYGVTDERDSAGKPTGRPEEAKGLGSTNETANQLRLENMIRDGISPRIAGVLIKIIPGFPSGSLMLVRVPRSLAAPHMVIFKNLSRFYGRNSAGKYQLDVGEIRSAFGVSESVPEKIRAFRTDRLARIAGGDTPIPFSPNRAVVLHLLPIAAADGRSSIDVSKEADKSSALLAPVMSANYRKRFNADGFLTYDSDPWGATSRTASTYVQVFRTGTLELADQRLMIRQKTEFDGKLPMAAFEKRLIEATTRLLKAQRDFGVAPPIVLMLSLLGVKGFALTTGQMSWTEGKIDKDALIGPDVLVEEFDVAVDRTLRPMFDFIWQAAGESESPNYDSDGNWKERLGM